MLDSNRDRTMKCNRYFMIIFLGLALACMPARASGLEDLAGLLEKRGPTVRGIITKPTIFREKRLPNLPISAKQAEFLMDNPRVSLALAHLYAPFLDSYSVEVGPDHVIHIADPGKLAGDAELIEARPGRRVYLIAGYFDIFRIRFHGHMVLATVYSGRRESAAVSTDATTSAHIKINSVFARALARLADYLFPRKVDERIERFVRAAESIAIGVHKDPAGAYGRLRASGEISAEELGEFGRVFQAGHSGSRQ